MDIKKLDPLSYEQIAADIIKISATGDNIETQKTVRDMCHIYGDFLHDFTARTNGYMVMTAFLVSFTEMKKVLNAAQPADKQIMEGMILAIIGSFGKVVH